MQRRGAEAAGGGAQSRNSSGRATRCRCPGQCRAQATADLRCGVMLRRPGRGRRNRWRLFGESRCVAAGSRRCADGGPVRSGRCVSRLSAAASVSATHRWRLMARSESGPKLPRRTQDRHQMLGSFTGRTEENSHDRESAREETGNGGATGGLPCCDAPRRLRERDRHTLRRRRHKNRGNADGVACSCMRRLCIHAERARRTLRRRLPRLVLQKMNRSRPKAAGVRDALQGRVRSAAAAPCWPPRPEFGGPWRISKIRGKPVRRPADPGGAHDPPVDRRTGSRPAELREVQLGMYQGDRQAVIRSRRAIGDNGR